MGSPEATSAMDFQGSPLFKYLCSLSPIQQTKPLHVAQTYSELIFPPPPKIFISPPATSHEFQRPSFAEESLLNNCTTLEADFLNNSLRFSRSLGFGENASRNLYDELKNAEDDSKQIKLDSVETTSGTANNVPDCVSGLENNSSVQESEANLNIQQQEGKVTGPGGQRGLRRRCLDFEASEELPDNALPLPTTSNSPVSNSLAFEYTNSNSSMSMSSIQCGLHLNSIPGLGFSAAANCSNLVVSFLEKPRLDQQELTPADLKTDPVTETKSQLSTSLGFPEDSLDSPESPKKRNSGEKSSADCKRCKCKKSRCLKLYCECFAAGVYCVDSCTCRDCFNKPEYAGTVLGTRQQIETRNPLAFAPKVIRVTEMSPTDDKEEPTSTPASARHKRGCNCKRSLCLKKYCECYQAGVGCSDGCKCEGCKNIYGRNEGLLAESEDDKEPPDPPDEKEFEDNTVKMDRFVKISQQRNISPITPHWELKGIDKAGKCGMKRSQLSSPLSSSTVWKQSRLQFTSSATKTATTSTSTSTSTTPQELVRKMKMMKSPSTIAAAAAVTTVAAPSPGWDGLDDICTLTPLPQHPTRPDPSSIQSSLKLTCSESPGINPESLTYDEEDDEEGDEIPSFMDAEDNRKIVTGSPKHKRITPPRLRTTATTTTTTTRMYGVL